MVLFLLNSIFLALGTLSTLFFQIIFNVTAYMLVLVIQSFKVPGEAAKGVLEQVADVIKLCVEYLVGFTWEVISSLVSALFDVVKEGIFDSVVATGSAIGGLLEHTRNSVDGFLKELIPEVLEGFSEMISTIVTDIWNNYKEAVGYVTKNA